MLWGTKWWKRRFYNKNNFFGFFGQSGFFVLWLPEPKEGHSAWKTKQFWALFILSGFSMIFHWVWRQRRCRSEASVKVFWWPRFLSGPQVCLIREAEARKYLRANVQQLLHLDKQLKKLFTLAEGAFRNHLHVALRESLKSLLLSVQIGAKICNKEWIDFLFQEQHYFLQRHVYYLAPTTQTGNPLKTVLEPEGCPRWPTPG